jgi:EAL domain-containing protein (putative c-di-GMP-specific phosphodiesterase class I)
MGDQGLGSVTNRIDGWLQGAEAAPRHAPCAGRNGCPFESDDADSTPVTVTQNVDMEGLLRGALARQELTLHYQPQVDLDNRRIVGVEALLRWRNPLLGNVTPAEFIPLAEQTGLIVPIGEWVLRTACSQARIWREIGLPPLRMAVNVSPRQFIDVELIQVIARILRETGLRPDYLELEITESLLAQDGVADILRALKRLGVRLAVYDFGAGRSNLGHLRRLPIDRIKIAQAFVRDIGGEDDDQAIAAAIIAVARGLRLDLIAEGVETETQLAFLRALNCHEIQGFLFSQPHPADYITTLIRNYSKSPGVGLGSTRRAPSSPLKKYK